MAPKDEHEREEMFHHYFRTAYDRASGRVNDPGADDIITASKLSG